MLTNKDLGAYLKKIRNDKDISLREVEKLTDIGYAHLSMIENGKRNVTPALLKNLASLYNVDYLDLYEKAGYIDLIEDETRNKIQNNSFIYACPVYGQISAGIPNWVEECIEGRLPIDPNMMNIVDPEECFFLRVNGESMNKVVRNGAYALIRKQDYAEDGDIVVAIVNGDNEATLKRFKRFNEQFVSFEPMSSDESIKPINVDLKNTNVIILGKYIGKFEMK